MFCQKNGEWLHTKAYCSALSKICKKHKIKVTNNHAMRMSLNSNVFIPNGINEADRARLLGHSIQTNLIYYSYTKKDYLETALKVLNGETDREPKDVENTAFIDEIAYKDPLRTPYSIPFSQKEKAHERRIHKVFS